jgi:hypothetical protein
MRFEAEESSRAETLVFIWVLCIEKIATKPMRVTTRANRASMMEKPDSRREAGRGAGSVMMGLCVILQLSGTAR